jgi:hypothetical protein
MAARPERQNHPQLEPRRPHGRGGGIAELFSGSAANEVESKAGATLRLSSGQAFSPVSLRRKRGANNDFIAWMWCASLLMGWASKFAFGRQF